MILLHASLEQIGGLKQNSGEHARAHTRKEMNCKLSVNHLEGGASLNGIDTQLSSGAAQNVQEDDERLEPSDISAPSHCKKL